LTRIIPGQHIATLVQYCKELEKRRQNWLQHKKEATWRYKRVKTQKQELDKSSILIWYCDNNYFLKYLLHRNKLK
jgi:CCR4-NOT transcriptional regulation complex NOT5 subunit